MLNRSPTLSIKDMTPEEAWSNEKPSVELFRVFGCIGHVHVPDARRTKLDSKSTRCILLGICDGTKGYRLYDPIAKKIVTSRDVVFEEENMWNWEANEKAEAVMDLVWEDEETIEKESEAVATEAEVFEANNTSSNNLDKEREVRVKKKPAWMDNYVSGEGLSEDEELVNMAMVESADPTTFKEAVKHEKWRQAMEKEINSIEKNEMWELTSLPVGAKRIGVRWVYKTKFNEAGEVDSLLESGLNALRPIFSNKDSSKVKVSIHFFSR